MTNNDKALAALEALKKVSNFTGMMLKDEVETIRQALTPQSSADTPKPNTPSVEALEALSEIEECVSAILLEAHRNGVTALAKWKFSDQFKKIRAAITAPIEKIEGLDEAIEDLENNVCGRGSISDYSDNSLDTVLKAARLQLQRQGD